MKYARLAGFWGRAREQGLCIFYKANEQTNKYEVSMHQPVVVRVFSDTLFQVTKFSLVGSLQESTSTTTHPWVSMCTKSCATVSISEGACPTCPSTLPPSRPIICSHLEVLAYHAWVFFCPYCDLIFAMVLCIDLWQVAFPAYVTFVE